jgi:hypothetical protein
VWKEYGEGDTPSSKKAVFQGKSLDPTAAMNLPTKPKKRRHDPLESSKKPPSYTHIDALQALFARYAVEKKDLKPGSMFANFDEQNAKDPVSKVALSGFLKFFRSDP